MGWYFDPKQWREPPPDVKARVEQELGSDVYTKLAEGFARIARLDPNLRFTQWYRSPEEALREKQLHPDRAALYTQHGLGLASDVTPSSPMLKQQVAQAARAAGFYVSSYPETTHLHIAALSAQQWAAATALQNYLRARMAPILARRGD